MADPVAPSGGARAVLDPHRFDHLASAGADMGGEDYERRMAGRPGRKKRSEPGRFDHLRG